MKQVNNGDNGINVGRDYVNVGQVVVNYTVIDAHGIYKKNMDIDNLPSKDQFLLFRRGFTEMLQFRKVGSIMTFFFGAFALWAEQFMFDNSVPMIHNFAASLCLTAGVVMTVFHKRLESHIENHCRQRILKNYYFRGNE